MPTSGGLVRTGGRRRVPARPRAVLPRMEVRRGGGSTACAPETRTAPAPQSFARPPRLLVADDDASMRVLLSVNLGVGGFEVVEAASGVEALELARASTFDLALLDVMMPDLSGHDVARAMRGEAWAIPFIFVSARAAREDVRLGFEAGCLDYVTKPFDPVEITDRVGEVLDRIRAGEAEAYRAARLERLGLG